MSTSGKIKAKNARNAEAARQGKTKPRPSFAERAQLDKKPAVAPWVVWAFILLLGGGSESSSQMWSESGTES
ncbi:hypothetical protein BCV69DRAFT_279421 [Microstroma glucosiphilum]|uniref:Stress-associated endoplasmic reticulum protein n=1 Tax=Pseudomicrostroma glucosiphilum TaxID=1684307 RepID=A0A316UDY5_9BASI|nr:hypothetical protein BCV69DRAFT_279421 [Pseudomicrostroma glucosiphilum]PWN23477.1 hypothetical protein BCV69DRAFT_279421 [Pseudomicrostroma glucosiphilum]